MLEWCWSSLEGVEVDWRVLEWFGIVLEWCCQSASCVCQCLLSLFVFWTVWPYWVGQVVQFVCNFRLGCQCLTGCGDFSCLPLLKKKIVACCKFSCRQAKHKCYDSDNSPVYRGCPVQLRPLAVVF